MGGGTEKGYEGVDPTCNEQNMSTFGKYNSTFCHPICAHNAWLSEEMLPV